MTQIQIGDHVKHTDSLRHLELGPGEVKARWTNYCECKTCYGRVGAAQLMCQRLPNCAPPRQRLETDS